METVSRRWQRLCVGRNASEVRWRPNRSLFVQEQLQQEREVVLASSMLASDLATKLDKQEDEVQVIKAIGDALQAQSLVENEGKSVCNPACRALTMVQCKKLV